MRATVDAQLLMRATVDAQLLMRATVDAQLLMRATVDAQLLMRATVDAQLLMYATAHGGCTDTTKEPAQGVDCGRKIPVHHEPGVRTRVSVALWFFSWALYWLSYPRSSVANELAAPLASVLAKGVSVVSLCCFSSSFLPSAVQFQCCFTSTETVRTVRGRGAQDGHLHFHTAPELWNHGLQVQVQCCFTSTETLLGTGSPGRTPRLSHSSILTSESGFVVALRPQRLYGPLGTGSSGGPPRLSDISTLSSVVDRSSSVLLYAHIDRGECWGRGAQDGHLDSHTAPGLCSWQLKLSVDLRPRIP